MTTVESGTAVGVEYVPDETRAVAIHEAGHAAASHVYMKDVMSTRLSIRKRGGSLGHHQAIEKEERFSSWRSEEMGKLIWTLGAMAAERVFYGENSTGVGGDVQSATGAAAWMVGVCAMGPERVDLDGPLRQPEEEDAEREKIMKRFEAIGSQIMNRARSGGPLRAGPARQRAVRPGKRARRRPDPRAGLRHRLQPHRAQPRRGRADRRRRSSSGARSRRRGRRAARPSQARASGDRPPGGLGMAEDLTPAEAPEHGHDLARREESSGAVEPYQGRTPPPYAGRFRLVFAVLGGIVGAAAAAVVLLAGASPDSNTVSGGWSSWHPSRDGQAAFQQIADHVAADYRLQNGKQLVAATGGPLELANLPVTVAVKPVTSGGNIALVEGNGVLYTLCGLGKKCAISSGKPTQVRHLLLRRESLELALYTFRYVRDVDLVVVFLPPPPGKDASQAMLYRAKDVKGELDRPLVATLPGPAPRPNSFPASQAASVNALTAPHLFKFTLEQGQNASVFLVLDRLLK